MTDTLNPPAFPSSLPFTEDGKRYRTPTGLSARAYFAAHAPITMKDALDYLRAIDPEAVRDYTTVLRTLAEMRVAYADEMMKAGAV